MLRKTGIVLDQEAVLKEYKMIYSKDTVDMNEFVMFVKHLRSQGFIIENIDLDAIQQLSNLNLNSYTPYIQEVEP